MPNIEKKCEYCGTDFVAKNRRAKYCKPSHRVMAFHSPDKKIDTSQYNLSEAANVLIQKYKKKGASATGVKALAFMLENIQEMLLIEQPRATPPSIMQKNEPQKPETGLSYMERRRLMKM